MGLHSGRKVATQLTAHRDGSVGRDCPRRGTHFSTARKVSKRATPRSGFWAAGPKVPCASRSRRAGTTRCGSNKRPPYRRLLRCSAEADGGERQKRWQLFGFSQFLPLLPGRASQQWREKASLLFERSEFGEAPPLREAQGTPQSGARQLGRLSLVSFFAGTKKETAPPGAVPAKRPIKKSDDGATRKRATGGYGNLVPLPKPDRHA